MTAAGAPKRGLGLDALLVAMLMVVAAVVRLHGADSFALHHFDEGGYAMSAQALSQGELPDGMYPQQHFLSPPLYFGIAGIAMHVLDLPADRVHVLISALFGILTIPLLYVLGRTVFGRPAATAAALLLALSGFHVALSRMGLTDVAFCFFFLLALLGFIVAERRESILWSVLAGLAVGLAWNTKYHGWLAGVVAAGALLPAFVRGSGPGRVAMVRRFAISVLVACLAYLPWYLWVDSREGGYARLVQEHRAFLRGYADFAGHIVAHARIQLCLDGWWGRAVPTLALLAAMAVGGRRSLRLEPVLWALALAGSSLLGGQAAAVGVAGVAGFALVLVRPRHDRWILAGFFLIFCVLTPLYHAYGRLLLPWTCAACLMAGYTCQRLAEPGSLSRRARGCLAAAILVAGPAAYAGLGWSPPMPEQEGGGFRQPSRDASAAMPGTLPIYVVGEPAVVFYLREEGRQAWHVNRPQEAFAGHAPGDSFWLVGGRYSRQTGDLDRVREHHGMVLEPVATLPVRVNDVRVIDDYGPRRARTIRRDEPDVYDLHVMRVTLP